MNISSRDNATPVFLLKNCAGHLLGPLRTIGATVVGQLGKSGHLGREITVVISCSAWNSGRQAGENLLGSQDGEGNSW